MTSSISRRSFLTRSGALVGGSALGGTMLLGGCGGSSNLAAIGVSDKERPRMPSGIQFGDITDNRAIIWSRSDRIAQMVVEYDTSERFNNVSRINGPHATDTTDFTTRVD
jgi:alkaline phosphatase D